MRIFASMIITFGLLTNVYAGSLIYEDFEGATPGTSLNGYKGWTSAENAIISNATIDQGQSLEFVAGDAWPSAEKQIPTTPSNGDYYVLSATLYAPGENGGYAQVGLFTPDPYAIAKIMLGYGGLDFFVQTSAEDVAFPPYGVALNCRVTPQPTDPVDVQMVIKEGRTDCFYRLDSETEWTHACGVDYGDPSLYSVVQIVGHGDWPGNIDTISLNSVPEPGTISLCIIGMVMLFALRRRP